RGQGGRRRSAARRPAGRDRDPGDDGRGAARGGRGGPEDNEDGDALGGVRGHRPERRGGRRAQVRAHVPRWNDRAREPAQGGHPLQDRGQEGGVPPRSLHAHRGAVVQPGSYTQEIKEGKAVKLKAKVTGFKENEEGSFEIYDATGFPGAAAHTVPGRV